MSRQRAKSFKRHVPYEGSVVVNRWVLLGLLY